MNVAESYWSDWHNAEVYNSYVREYPIYRALNRRLAELADLAGARRVLDLACGAGATALACLRRLPRDAELVGVDASEAMVALARAEVRDPRARFEVAAAASLAGTVGGSFDRVLCNAAFWQLAMRRAVLAELAKLLEPGALFVFNVPAEMVVGEPSDVHSLQVALARAIEAQTGHPFSGGTAFLDTARLKDRLDRAGFELAARERFVYEGRQEELMELMKIPAMIGPLTPELTSQAREAVLARAEQRTDPEQSVTVPWIYFSARRRE